jgi:hypothetical protein
VLELRETERNGVGPELANKQIDTSPGQQSKQSRGIIKYAMAARLIQFVSKKVLKLRETE